MLFLQVMQGLSCNSVSPVVCMCRTVDAENDYEKALLAILGEQEHTYRIGSQEFTRKLKPPSVVIHTTATPFPTFMRLYRAGVEVTADNYFRLGPFPNYVSKKQFKSMIVDGNEVWLNDGDLSVNNLFADHWKAQCWVEDLTSYSYGIGVHIANSRGVPFVLVGCAMCSVC